METIKARTILLPDGDWYMDKPTGSIMKYIHDSGVGPVEGLTTKEINVGFPVEYQNQHLYGIVDEKPKEGDWAYNSITKKVILITIVDPIYKKIVVATDTLSETTKSEYIQFNTKVEETKLELLPQFPQSFIEEYCRKGGIDEVLIEENCCYCFKFGACCEDYQIKVNPDNTVNILLKDSWSREKVEKLCREAYIQGAKDNIHDGYWEPENSLKKELNNWIKENLSS